MWMSFVKNILVTMKSGRVLCLVYGLYPSYVDCILKYVEEIIFIFFVMMSYILIIH